MGVKFVRVRKDGQGNITHLLTNAGQVLSINQARTMTLEGDVDSFTDIYADGTWIIDGTAGQAGYEIGYNLNQLPDF